MCVYLFIQLRLFGFNFRPCVIVFDFAFYFSRVLGHDIISRNEPPPSECLTLLSDHTAEQYRRSSGLFVFHVGRIWNTSSAAQEEDQITGEKNMKCL